MSVNKAIILGNLGKDPEVRHMQDGRPVVNLTIATSDRWKDKASGEQREKTEWHRIVLFDQPAEVAEKYLKKGDQAYFEGKIQTRKWTDNNGQDRYTTEVVVDRIGGKIQMLRNGNSGGGSADSYAQHTRDGGGQSASAAAPQPQATKPAMATTDAPFDDDIPF